MQSAVLAGCCPVNRISSRGDQADFPMGHSFTTTVAQNRASYDPYHHVRKVQLGGRSVRSPGGTAQSSTTFPAHLSQRVNSRSAAEDYFCGSVWCLSTLVRQTLTVDSEVLGVSQKNALMAFEIQNHAYLFLWVSW